MPPLSVVLDNLESRVGHDFTDVGPTTSMYPQFADALDGLATHVFDPRGNVILMRSRRA